MKRSRRQSGAVLLVVMIILAVLTVLALSTSEIATLETKMVGSRQDRELAFQAAEGTLAAVEAKLAALDDRPVPDDTTIFELGKAPLPRTDGWWGKATEYDLEAGISKKSKLLSTPPRYIIEEIQNDSATFNDMPNVNTTTYRITAEGRGSSLNARVVLQSEFKQTYYNVISMRGRWPMNMVMLMPDFSSAMCFSDACQLYFFGWTDGFRDGKPVTLNVDFDGPFGFPAFGNMFFMMNMLPGDKTFGEMFKDMMDMPLKMMQIMTKSMTEKMMKEMVGKMIGGLCPLPKCEEAMMLIMTMPLKAFDKMMSVFSDTIMKQMMDVFMQPMMKMWGTMGKLMENMMGAFLPGGTNIRNLNIRMRGGMNMMMFADMPGEGNNVCINQSGMMNMAMIMDPGMSGTKMCAKSDDGTEVCMDIPGFPDWISGKPGALGAGNDAYRIRMRNAKVFGMDVGGNFVGIGDAAGNDTYVIGTGGPDEKLKVGMDMVMTMDMTGNDSYRIFTGGSDEGGFMSDLFDFGNNMDMAMVMDMSPRVNDRHFGKSKPSQQESLVCTDGLTACDRFDIRTDFGLKVPLVDLFMPTEGYHGVWPGFGFRFDMLPLPSFSYPGCDRSLLFGGSCSEPKAPWSLTSWMIPFSQMMPMHDSTPTQHDPEGLDDCSAGPGRLSWREVWE